LVQESIAEGFYTKLRARMDGLRIGNPLDKCIDVGAVVDPVQLATIAGMVDANTAGETYRAATPLPDGCFYPPTLITGLTTSDRLMQDEIFGPVLVSTTFRTPAEAVALANNTRYGLAATVWSENINLALDIAPKLVAGIVWINATNLMDAAAGFGGLRESGFGREGGWEGLAAYSRAKGKSKSLGMIAAKTGEAGPTDGIDRTAKMYVGGKQARPDAGYSRAVYGRSGAILGHVGQASRKDVRNAVEAAQGAAGWARTTGHLRAQILYYIAENLSARSGEFAGRINDMTGKRQGAKEVATSIQTLFTYAAWADKYDGQVHGVPIRGVALAMKEPVGTIGVMCADEAPLLGLIAAMAPAIAMGNRVVLAASEPYPLAATDFYQVLDTSDVPGGVVNILTGCHGDIAPTLASHLNVDAMWSFSSSDLSGEIERASAGNLKRTWVNNACAMDWYNTSSAQFLAASTDVKNIWVPYGE
jgi:aldehyde dehydrogenase (NAD+)